MTANKGNSIITPKVNTVGADPETHRKMLEKMLQDAEMNNLENDADAPGNVISLGGAFTKKQSQLGEQVREYGTAGESREGSNKKKDGNEGR